MTRCRRELASMQPHRNITDGASAGPTWASNELKSFRHGNVQNHERPRVTAANPPFSIEHDDFFVTVRIQTESHAGTVLLISVSPRSVLLFAPNEQETESDTDLLCLFSLPAEIDPEKAEVSLLGGELVLILPVSPPSST